MADTAFREFTQSQNGAYRDNQRLVVAQAVGDAERSLSLLDLPEEVWTHNDALDCVVAIRNILTNGGKPTMFAVQDELTALNSKDALRNCELSGYGYLAQCEWNDAVQSILSYHKRRQRHLWLIKASEELNKTTDLEAWDRSVLQAGVSLQGRTKRQTGGTETEIVRSEVQRVRAGTDRKGFMEIGFPKIDRATDGFGPGQLVIIAAWPGGGKTTFAVQLAQHIAKTYGPVYFEELEMNLRELARRRISSISGSDINHWTQEDLELALTKSEETQNLYYECAGGKLDEFLGRIHRRMLLYPDTKAIFVDYLGLLQDFGKGRRETSEANAVSDALKMIAQHYQVLVVAIQQPNRNIEGRVDKNPRTSDLRDSNKIVQDAHKILFLERPHDHDKSFPAYLVRCHVLKDRQGQHGGYIELCWKPSIFRFEPLEEQNVHILGEHRKTRLHVGERVQKINQNGPKFEEEPFDELSQLGDFL